MIDMLPTRMIMRTLVDLVGPVHLWVMERERGRGVLDLGTVQEYLSMISSALPGMNRNRTTSILIRIVNLGEAGRLVDTNKKKNRALRKG